MSAVYGRVRGLSTARIHKDFAVVVVEVCILGLALYLCQQCK